MNISNGGLILKHQSRLYVCDLENYQGTYILAEDSSIISTINGLMWFAAPRGNNIYYSNQKDNDYLYNLDTESLAENCLIKKPCSYIVAWAEQLFFLDETDKQIYGFDYKTGKTSPLIKEEVFSFIQNGGLLYCAGAKGLLEFDINSGRSQLLTGHIPMCLNITPKGLIFTDRSLDYSLSILYTGHSEPIKINNIKTQSIIAGKSHVYAINLPDNRSIVRVDITSGEAIRFCGEKADKLHIVDDYLYFLNQNDKNAWYKMPLSGGRSVRLLS